MRSMKREMARQVKFRMRQAEQQAQREQQRASAPAQRRGSRQRAAATHARCVPVDTPWYTFLSLPHLGLFLHRMWTRSA